MKEAEVVPLYLEDLEDLERLGGVEGDRPTPETQHCLGEIWVQQLL